MKRPLSWKAVRRGSVYCAPACGFGCTTVSHDRAARRGAALAKRLKKSFPGTWTVSLNHNMGWFYRAVSPCGRIMVNDGGNYPFHDRAGPSRCDAWLQSSEGGQFIAPGATPEKAVRAAILLARQKHKAIGQLIDGLQS